MAPDTIIAVEVGADSVTVEVRVRVVRNRSGCRRWVLLYDGEEPIVRHVVTLTAMERHGGGRWCAERRTQEQRALSAGGSCHDAIAEGCAEGLAVLDQALGHLRDRCVAYVANQSPEGTQSPGRPVVALPLLGSGQGGYRERMRAHADLDAAALLAICRHALRDVQGVERGGPTTEDRCRASPSSRWCVGGLLDPGSGPQAARTMKQLHGHLLFVEDGRGDPSRDQVVAEIRRICRSAGLHVAGPMVTALMAEQVEDLARQWGPHVTVMWAERGRTEQPASGSSCLL